MSGPYVVILTGGVPPGRDCAAPLTYQVDLALERGGCSPEQARDILTRHVAEEAWQAGYEEAAKLHRVVAAWVLDDKGEAERFAEFVTREIDPAFVAVARSPLGELLAAAEESRRRDRVAAGGAS